MGPVIREQLGFEVWTPRDFDTDQFGTFTREKARQGTQVEAARAKARAAMERYNYKIGIASEGSFAPHPQLPMVQSNLEIVLLIDDIHQVEIIGQVRSSATVPRSAVVQNADEAVHVATEWGFPAQGVIVRRSMRSTRHIYKDILDVPALRRVVQKELRWPWVRSVSLETDMRAHRHLTRMDTIAAATKDLAQRYNQRCPQCQTPGFVGVRVVATAQCAQCSLPTDVPCTEELRCQHCNYSEERPIRNVTPMVDPGQCARCNP